jgi:cbb3-type cytochrome oxidase maturation protein
MEILTILIPVSLAMGGFGLAAFVWALRSGQWDDPKGDARRFLARDHDDRPRP